jgi:ceramide glucosyltransferase
VANLFAILGTTFGWLTILPAGCGVLYQMVAAVTMRRFFADHIPAPRRGDRVTLLKPLHGAEPRLFENLATFLTQDHMGPIQMVCGVQRADDPAIAIVEALRTAYPQTEIDLVVDPTVHGANAKVSNLINMAQAASSPVVILSDSDIAVAPDYVSRLLQTLGRPDVGVVSCLYRGRGDAGFWSRLGAAGVSYQFLPGVVIAVAYRLAEPCMGSTIALTDDTLQGIGGFEDFADTLADDHAIGQAVIAIGQQLAVPPMLVTHAFDERSFGALWRHELRWNATVRDIDLWSHIGAIVTMPLPLACLACLYAPKFGVALVAATVIARLFVVRTIDAAVGERTAPLWMALLHDFAAFAVYCASFFVRSVDWRGTSLTMKNDGRIAAATEH